MEDLREQLAARLLAPPTLAELAEGAGISRFQLLRRFAAVHGCTPHAWVMQQRAERARGLALADAAALAGFADQSHIALPGTGRRRADRAA